MTSPRPAPWPRIPRSRGLRAVAAVSLIAATLGLVPGNSAAQSPAGALAVPAHSSFDPLDNGDVVQVRALSTRADLVTGGDVLIEIVLPPATDLATVAVTAGTRDVAGAFRAAGPGLRGLVTGLANGQNTITATLPDGSSARLVVTNAPTGGPVFSGPLIQPWTCKNGSAQPDCSQPATITYHYKRTGGNNSLQAYNPSSPPNDVATTTTDDGNQVPFIVRQETGYSLRDQYRIAALWDPKQGGQPDPLADNPGYANKLVLTHGASCDTAYESGSAPDVLNVSALGQGMAVASHALDNAGHNCNMITQAESLILTKEMVVERFGPLRYTIGVGCSGGSLVQQQIANAYPGVFQAITPQCSFPDAWSSAQQYVDYVGLREYLEDPSTFPQHQIAPAQWPAIFGHANPGNQITFTSAIPNSGQSNRSCPGVAAADVWDEQTNPDGVRCSFQDYMRNVFGVFEDGPDKGKARRPISNVGIQYGLSGLLSFLRNDLTDPTRPPLTPAQFITLNANVGGYDIDFERTVTRTEADPIAQTRAFRTGVVNTGAHLDKVAIIDLGGPEPGAFHDVYRKYAMRERLLREHGTAENQVLWEGQTPLLGDATFVDAAIAKADDWMAAVEADRRVLPLARKIIEAKAKANVVPRCALPGGTDAPLTLCDATVDPTIFSSPRIEAGGGDQALVNGVGPAKVGFTDDRLDCETMPIEQHVYAGRPFSQVFTPAQQAALRAAFPTGVCDYSKPGHAFQDAVIWLRYQDAGGRVVFGGEPMGSAPTSVFEAARSLRGELPATGTGRGITLVLGVSTLALLALTMRRRLAPQPATG